MMTTSAQNHDPIVRHGAADRQLTVRYEFMVVDGDAAKDLMQRQAAVVREALEYFARHSDASGPPQDARTRPATASPRPQGDDLLDLD